MAEKGAPTGHFTNVPPQLQVKPFNLREADARLMVRRPGLEEIEVEIEKAEFTIGRHADEVDLVLDDEWVSKRHARITADDRGYFTLEDLGSKNGVEFRGRIARRINLVNGDEFKIGQTHFVFLARMPRFEMTPDGLQRAPEASIMADVDVPGPKPEDADDDDEPIGWDPRRAAAEPSEKED